MGADSSVINALQAWVAAFPPGIVRGDTEPALPDADNGAVLSIRLTPHARHACPIDLRITSLAAGSCIAVHLDTWEQIAERRGFAVAPQDRSRIGFFLEPAAHSVDDPLALCCAVAAGAVTRHVHLRRSAIIGVTGTMHCPRRSWVMRGSWRFPAACAWRRCLGAYRRVTVQYEPWTAMATDIP